MSCIRSAVHSEHSQILQEHCEPPRNWLWFASVSSEDSEKESKKNHKPLTKLCQSISSSNTNTNMLSTSPMKQLRCQEV